MIIIIAFKGAIQDFLQLPPCRAVSNTYTQVARAQLCANPVQHTEHLLHATCRVAHGMKGQLCYQVWQSLNHIYFSFILLAELLAYEAGEETRAPGENPWWQALENATN